ncbi:MAG: cysteine-rich CWC family protein [Pseudomonadota bacterium]
MKSRQEPARSEPSVAGVRRCPACGSRFVCGMAAGQSPCWCADLPPITIDPQAGGCFCPACLKTFSASRPDPASE